MIKQLNKKIILKIKVVRSKTMFALLYVEYDTINMISLLLAILFLFYDHENTNIFITFFVTIQMIYYTFL